MTDFPLAEELGLRFTEREVPLTPPDVAAFARTDPTLSGEQQAGHDDRAAILDLVAAELLAAHARVVRPDDPERAPAPVFVNLPATPIPARFPTVLPAAIPMPTARQRTPRNRWTHPHVVTSSS